MERSESRYAKDHLYNVFDLVEAWNISVYEIALATRQEPASAASDPRLDGLEGCCYQAASPPA